MTRLPSHWLSSTADVHLNNYMFDGARADLSKSLNMNPAFQVTHSFTLGASAPNPMGGPATAGGPGTYMFGALFATNKVRFRFDPVLPSSLLLASQLCPLPARAGKKSRRQEKGRDREVAKEARACH